MSLMLKKTSLSTFFNRPLNITSTFGLPALGRLFLVTVIFLFLSACVTTSSSPGQPKLASSAQAKRDANASVHTKLAQEYMRQRQWGTAKKELEESLRSSPNHSQSNYVMALLMMRLEQYSDTEKYFTRALKSDRNNSGAAHDFGVFLCQTGKEQESIEYFEMAVSNPLFDRAELSHMRAGECLSKIDDPRAELYLKKALSLNPRLRPALFRLAIIKHQSRSHLSARAHIERYFAITEPQPESLLLAYQIESSLNAKKVASAYRKTLLTNFPSSEQARSIRGSDRP